MTTFFDLVKSRVPAQSARGKKFLYRVPVGPGKFRYVYPGHEGKTGGGKGPSAKKPPIDAKLDQLNFQGQPINVAAFAALGKVVGMSSDRRVVRDRYGTKWGMVDGHLVRLSHRNQRIGR